jgi:hypothetical protein
MAAAHRCRLPRLRHRLRQRLPQLLLHQSATVAHHTGRARSGRHLVPRRRLSPLLSNIVLDDFDKELARRGQRSGRRWFTNGVLAHVRTPGGPTGPAQPLLRLSRPPPTQCLCPGLTRTTAQPTISAMTAPRFYFIPTGYGDVVAVALAQKDGLFMHYMLADDGESFHHDQFVVSVTSCGYSASRGYWFRSFGNSGQLHERNRPSHRLVRDHARHPN